MDTPAPPELTDRTRRALATIVDALASDVGRLSRRAEDESSLAFLADRLADQVENLDAIAHPCAAELYQDFLAITGSAETDIAADEALTIVSTRQRTLRAKLGRDIDGHRKTNNVTTLVEANAA